MEQPNQNTHAEAEAVANSTLRKSSIDQLSEAHREAVSQAISNVLFTEIAELTYAQIVDGLPLASVVDESGANDVIFCDDHPVYAHTELKQGALDTARSFRAAFDPQALEFDASLLQALQAGSPGSRVFNTRLIEVIAVAVHQIAVLLYKNNPDLSPSSTSSAVDQVHVWEPPKDPDSPWSTWWKFHPNGPHPALFHHDCYAASWQYPEGAADIAGYWAGSRIFGGVVLFDRVKAESDAVYLHPDRVDVTYRICQLTDTQKGALLRFLREGEHPDKDGASPSSPSDPP